ncbi:MULTISPECIES: hypothetical protein [Micrococcales]|uniref:Uncharacterized protein n=1 Tax=Herbiconiux daphne TaxID=2970914 RepID=A0ABT2H8W3_9MICO|nr:hypothetical protein [Herbiconiux daphne]MCS5736395.1 hypothetical protein [Herbiconiux daphne]
MLKQSKDDGYPITDKELAHAERLHRAVSKDQHPRLNPFDKGRIHAATLMLALIQHRPYEKAEDTVSHYLSWLSHWSHKDRAAPAKAK